MIGSFNVSIANAPTIGFGHEIILIQENSVVAATSYIINQNDFNPEKPRSKTETKNILIDCLIKYESGGDKNAKGKAGEIGILQFMPGTFDFFSKRYNLELDINNSNDQILLASKILEEDFDNVRYWSVYKKCIKFSYY